MKIQQKKEIELATWIRKDHYEFFSKFQEPFFGVTVNVDCSIAYSEAKKKGVSFFLYYLYRALKAANEIEGFGLRIEEDKVYLYDKVHASPTVTRPNGTFGFAYVDYLEDEDEFYRLAGLEMDQVKNGTGLFPSGTAENILHVTVLAGLHFTSLSHARNFSFNDSCPKISFGQMQDSKQGLIMPVAIHVHHALMDAGHINLLVRRFQELLNTVNHTI